jgi:NadR type nicotinamide-nucleotide adenylyltransferase
MKLITPGFRLKTIRLKYRIKKSAALEMKDQSPQIIKIAVVGPESTGKSTMAAYLAKHYQTVWVPEFAREYCEKLTEPPTCQDEINMFHGQLALEEEYLPKANNVLICDTTFITVKIWSDYTFGRSPQEVLDELPLHPYSLYLLLAIDLPWQEDPLRDFPHLREHFMEIWDKELKALNANYVVISGDGAARYDSAVSIIDSFLLGLKIAIPYVK